MNADRKVLSGLWFKSTKNGDFYSGFTKKSRLIEALNAFGDDDSLVVKFNVARTKKEPTSADAYVTVEPAPPKQA